ncbi:MAG: integrin alpha [Sumerlaeia bacterium]
MAPMGDFNNDGFDDFAVSAPGDLSNGTTRPGEVYVIFGAPTLP